MSDPRPGRATPEPAFGIEDAESSGPDAPAGDTPEGNSRRIDPPGERRGTPRMLLGRYLLEERIASGGMASVWRAHDEVLARTVAVKLLHDHLAADGQFRERFRREAISAAKLAHPNIVSIYDTGSDADTVFIVMEYIEGSTLKDVVREQGPLDVGQAAKIGEQVSRALDYAHDRGLVHRDVKPANILIGTDGTVKVADFGIAKADQADDLTKTGMVLGTAAYVAPEQIRGQDVDGKADQYSLGVVLFEAVTGQQPFRADTPVATAAQRLERQPPPPRSVRADIPRGLDAVLLRALAREPGDRFTTSGHLADALSAFAGADTGETAALVDHADPTTTVPELHEQDTSFIRSEGRFLLPVLVLVLLAAALVGVGLATGVLETRDGFPVGLARDSDPPGDEPEEAETTDAGLVVIPAEGLTIFDPEGSGVERDHELPNLLDGNAETAWRTERYRNRSDFGGLKPGVGVIVDLGEPHEVEAAAMRAAAPAPDLVVQLMAGDGPPGTLEEWRLVAEQHGVDEVFELRPGDAVTTRWLLVWLTGDLPPYDGGFAAHLSQLAVRAAPVE